ncbi:MAG: hypothetical protein MJE77_25310 [Proteobacteria bacterium]|nr:hypothetical protein [Pseudomonadota bacterium]
MNNTTTLWSYAHMRPGHSVPYWVRLCGANVQERERLWTFYQYVLGWSPDPLIWEPYKVAVPSPDDDFLKSFAGIYYGNDAAQWVPVFRVPDNSALAHFTDVRSETYGELGTVTLLRDTADCEIAIWEKDTSPGLETTILGAPVWFHYDCTTERDLDAYRAAFHWNVITDAHTPALRWLYRPADPDPVASALIDDTSGQCAWNIAFGVQNLGAAMQLVRKHGGTAGSTQLLPWEAAACHDPLFHAFMLMEPDAITAPQHHE